MATVVSTWNYLWNDLVKAGIASSVGSQVGGAANEESRVG
jgi:hypothetical protein